MLNDFDFRTTVTRAEFEEKCSGLFDRVPIPIQKVLAEADIAFANVSSIEVVGGSVRIPKLQSMIKETFNIEGDLSKTLNGDEAAALGAVFYAAHLSTGMRVPEHRIKDISPHGVMATVVIPKDLSADESNNEEQEDKDHLIDNEKSSEEEAEEDESLEEGNQAKILTLFKPYSRVGARKNLSFRSKSASNFTVELSYLNPEQLPEGTPAKIALYTISDIDKAKKYNFTGKPKILLSFKLSTSSLVQLERAEAEITVIKYPEPEPESTPEPEPSPSVAPETKVTFYCMT